MNILVTGANGQLGRCLQDLAPNFSDLKFSFKDSKQLDITNKESIDLAFQEESWDYLINCAAYTNVDKAEEEPEKAKLVNSDGAKYLAQACKTNNATLIHISTDFVFDGKKNKPYLETDKTNPLGVYGKTKLEGENRIIETLKEHIIIRTSWLYSEYGHNFVKTILRLALEKKKISVVDDQIGTPTYAGDLSEVIIKIILLKTTNYGIYHYSNEGECSWFDFAKAIFEESNTEIKLLPIKTDAYPTFAKRPSFSMLDKSKIKATFQISTPCWNQSLNIRIKKYKDLKLN